MDTPAPFTPILRPAKEGTAYIVEVKKSATGGWWPLCNNKGTLAWSTAKDRDEAIQSIRSQLQNTP